MEIKAKNTLVIDYIALCLIGFYSIFSSIHGANFAEISFAPYQLDFPIFIGEILFAICACLLLLKLILEKILWKRGHILLFLFGVWVLTKAFLGYSEYGPLSLRNAALFYYSFFAVFGYYFLGAMKINQWKLYLIIFSSAFIILVYHPENVYYWTTYILIIFASITKLKNKWIKIILLISAFSFLNMEEFFKGSRSNMVACASIFIFFIFIIYQFFEQKFPRMRLWALIILIFVFTGGVFLKGDHNSVKSLFYLNHVRDTFKHFDNKVQARKDSFEFTPIVTQLYRDNRELRELSSQGRLSVLRSPVVSKSTKKVNINEYSEITGVTQKETDQSFRTREVVNNNILFRLFIWRDMVEELVKSKKIFGISFGKPQRSISLEILGYGWGDDEYLRDGWIAPHNSLLHYIYRGGICGLAIVFGILYYILQLARTVLHKKDLAGIFFIAILVYWIVMSNFLVILELPYNAIPFWFLFGAFFSWILSPKSYSALENNP